MPRANTIFWFAIRIVFRAIFITAAILEGSSVIRTTSAASMAASEPRPPIAMPTSALASTGASLIPSPTNTSLPFSLFSFSKSSTQSTLSAGRSSVYARSRPRRPATFLPTASASPVSMTVLRIPEDLRFLIAAAASALISSSITIQPA